MPKSRRIYFQTEEITTVKKKGYIEIDEDFTQVYKSFNLIAPKIRSVWSWQLLFWIMANATTESNGVVLGNQAFEKFSKHLTKPITSVTFYNCVKDLVDAGCLTKVGKGHYYLNPYIFWFADKASRVEFIQDEKKEGTVTSVNPVTMQLDAPKSPSYKKIP